MTTILRDARFGLRLLRRNLGFSAVAVITLALGIAATTAIFSVVYGLFFAPLPYYKADRLVMLWEYEHANRLSASAKSYAAWKREATAFADVNAWAGQTVNLATADRPENVSAGVATPGFLAMLGYGHPLALGRTFRDEEGIPGRNRVVILTYQLWHDRFDADPNIVGRQVRIDDVPFTVVGVLGRGPADRQQNKIWLPLALTDAQLQTDDMRLMVMARLKEDVTLAQANESLAALSARLEQQRSTPRDGWTARVEEFRNDFVRDGTKRGVWLLLGAVGFLLLIACANVANLLLARGTARHRELAIRAAMGATRASVVRQLLVESLLLALTGGVLGALLASSIIDGIVALMPPFTLPSETEITLSIPVLLFAFAMCTIAGVVAGMAPAWQASRASAGEAMKEGGRTIGDGRSRLRHAFVVVEFALALTLLAGGALAVHALLRMVTADLGFRPDHLTTFVVPVPRGRFTTAEQATLFYGTLSERLALLPDVASASISIGTPAQGTFNRPFEIAGRPIAAAGAQPRANLNMVSPGYHSTFGIQIRRGRTFIDDDRAASRPVAIVNETFASRFLAGRDPIGQRLLIAPSTFARSPQTTAAPIEWEIIGVQADTANAGPARPTDPEILVPFAQRPWPQVIVAVRTMRAVSAPQAAIADTIRALDPTLPMARVRTMEQALKDSTASDRFYAVFLAAFAGAALVLAAVGIYGVMSAAVAQRTQEIGIRMALGGRTGQVLGQVLREGMATALIGTALGGIGARAIGKALQGTVYGVQAGNPMVFATAAATLLLVALVACVVPAYRAASIDPMLALRKD